jgi:energy-coupling factor transport system ATP-binding protein
VRETRGTTVVHVTHRASELADAGRLVALAEGRIAFAGDPADARDPARAEQLGLVPEPLPPVDRSDAVPPPDGEAIVRAESVSFRADFAGEILRAVSMEIRPGERLGLLGPSGAGKTTLVSLLAGLLEPSAGRVEARGGDRSVVGLVFQEPERAFFEASVLDDVAFGPRNRGLTPDAAREAARDALRRVGLDPEAIGPRLPETLSGGEARRAAIAGILAFAPRAVLFDEPTTGLDAEGTRRLREILARLAADGIASLMVSHDLPLVRAECDRVIVLREGEIAWQGPVAQLDANLPPEWADVKAGTDGPKPPR